MRSSNDDATTAESGPPAKKQMSASIIHLRPAVFTDHVRKGLDTSSGIFAQASAAAVLSPPRIQRTHSGSGTADSSPNTRSYESGLADALNSEVISNPLFALSVRHLRVLKSLLDRECKSRIAPRTRRPTPREVEIADFLTTYIALEPGDFDFSPRSAKKARAPKEMFTDEENTFLMYHVSFMRNNNPYLKGGFWPEITTQWNVRFPANPRTLLQLQERMNTLIGNNYIVQCNEQEYPYQHDLIRDDDSR